MCILLLWHWLSWQQVHVQTKECGGHCSLCLFCSSWSLSTPLCPPTNAPPLHSLKVFALEYFKQETDGLIKSEDGAYMLSFAIMMLHTSLHNPSVRHRTTKKQWVSMNRGEWVSWYMGEGGRGEEWRGERGRSRGGGERSGGREGGGRREGERVEGEGGGVNQCHVSALSVWQ